MNTLPHRLAIIADYLHAPPRHLPVELVQVDVGKQGAWRPSLLTSFFRLDKQALYHDAALEVLLYEVCDTLVLDLFPYHVHEQFVVERIEVFG